MKRFYYLIIASTFVLMSSCKKNPVDNESYTISYVLSLQPNSIDGKDAFIEYYSYEDYTNKNWGSSVEFAAISWTASGQQFIVRSFIDFNFDMIPENAVIDNAELSLFAYGNTSHGMGHDTLSGTNESYLKRVIEPWHEDLITWNTQPNTTEINQVLIPRSDSTMQDYIGINITNLVRDIYNNRAESHGFMFRLKNEEDYRRMYFGTSDVEEENKRPKLIVNYTMTYN